MRWRDVSFAVVLCLAARGAWAWTGAASPHDAAHLVVIKAADFRTVTGERVGVVEQTGAFAHQAIAVNGPALARLRVRHAGQYTLWIRVNAPVVPPGTLQVTLAGEKADLLTGAVPNAEKSTDDGGRLGYEAYARAANKTGAAGRSDQLAPDPDKSRPSKSKNVGQVEDDLEAEIKLAAGEKPRVNWTHDTRLEELDPKAPYYWWKLGSVKLELGEYQLRLAPTAGAPRKATISVDAAFLTTSTELVYPFLGDLDAPPASYLRFRIDELPKQGLTIGAQMRVHYDPWGTGHGWLNPDQLQKTKAEPHQKIGYTRWYRLQDLEKAPPFGATEAHLQFDISPPPGAANVRGATQFAVFPHSDYVLREIDWNEPEGLRISLLTDFETYLHRLRTLRDHAREDYDRARSATGEQMFPLTRDDLYFGNAWGGADGECVDYMAKTLRQLGFNCVGQSNEAVEYRKLYGWTSHGAQYSVPEDPLPFDEDASRRSLTKSYQHSFDKQREFYEGVSIFQLADEPGEISREAMSAPLWIYSRTADGERYTDLSGNSQLTTRRCDLKNCALEGKLEKHGTSLSFRVAVDDAEHPTRYAYWNVGKVTPGPQNVVAGRIGMGPETQSAAKRPAAGLTAATTQFKIVYEGTSAVLYLDGQLVHQQVDLATTGGFSILGPPKAVLQLRLRPLRAGEHVSETADVAVAEKKKNDLAGDLDVEELLGSEKAVPDWAQPKSLERALREDWVVGGGMPQAHAGFRQWAQAQGLTPETFGGQSWDAVRMLTLPQAIASPADARRFYYSRKYSGYLTPRMFALAAEAIQTYGPNHSMKSFVALSGHSLYFPSEMPLDMFELAGQSPALMPGVSDWMSLGGWRWDSHQAVAYSVAMFNAGARRYGREPVSFPMMHCVWPMDIRSYTMLANQVRYISFYNFGPSYAVTEGHWNDSPDAYLAVHNTTNRASQVDDILCRARARSSRVALLYSISTEYWNAQSCFADRRAAFLGMSHDYYQPEMITEDQIVDGALDHYDALYVLDPYVLGAAQDKIADWVKQGGLLWTCADSLQRNEFNEPRDLLAALTGIERTFAPSATLRPAGSAVTNILATTVPDVVPADKKPPGPPRPLKMAPVAGELKFRPHIVATQGMPEQVRAPDKTVRVRARYDDQRPAWLEAGVGQGKVVYLGHRAGLTYTAGALHPFLYHTVWADTGRDPLTLPLLEAKIPRELTLSQPSIVAAPLSTDTGTVIILYNMHPQPVKDLVISLQESQAPHSVQAFQGHVLGDVPFEYRDGLLRMKLPSLEGSQMIVVRRQPAPTDERLGQIHESTKAQLASDDRRALAAGAWFAGYFPQHDQTERLVALLAHPHWSVRRAAAESLGRRGDSSAADPIVAQIARETDLHALTEEVSAVARLGDVRAIELCRKYSGHADAYLRGRVLRGARALLSKNLGKQTAEFIEPLVNSGLEDPDFRMREAAIELLASYQPKQAAARAVQALTDAEPSDPITRPVWIGAIAQNDLVFEAWIAAGMPGGDAVLMEIAARRADGRLAEQVTARRKSLPAELLPQLTAVAVKQRDRALTRTLFRERDSLPAALQPYVPLMLECAFDARLGINLDDWQSWLDAHPQ